MYTIELNGITSFGINPYAGVPIKGSTMMLVLTGVFFLLRHPLPTRKARGDVGEVGKHICVSVLLILIIMSEYGFCLQVLE